MRGSIRTTPRQVCWGHPLRGGCAPGYCTWRHASASRGGHCARGGKAPLGRLLHSAAGAWRDPRDAHHGRLPLIQHVGSVSNARRGAARMGLGVRVGAGQWPGWRAAGCMLECMQHGIVYGCQKRIDHVPRQHTTRARMHANTPAPAAKRHSAALLLRHAAPAR